MSYNTGQQKHKSVGLEGLDCGQNIKLVPVDDNFPDAVFTASATRVVGIGECVAMIRVAANTVLLGAEFYWNDAAPAAIVSIGDPFACARIFGPIHTGTARGTFPFRAGDTCGPWGTCASLMKMGTEGDGCGFMYKWTCDTDILMTNNYHSLNATMGGWSGGVVDSGAGAADAQVSVAITAGTYRLVLHTKKATSIT